MEPCTSTITSRKVILPEGVFQICQPTTKPVNIVRPLFITEFELLTQNDLRNEFYNEYEYFDDDDARGDNNSYAPETRLRSPPASPSPSPPPPAQSHLSEVSEVVTRLRSPPASPSPPAQNYFSSPTTYNYLPENLTRRLRSPPASPYVSPLQSVSSPASPSSSSSSSSSPASSSSSSSSSASLSFSPPASPSLLSNYLPENCFYIEPARAPAITFETNERFFPETNATIENFLQESYNNCNSIPTSSPTHPS
ncbi:orf6 [Artaxa digramma nucleopolyhedrovirus]|uniref:Orf6 n=1 Tax=Artaxa digramma nucleopolyhedrovirus TaxID=3070910 RepID=A0AAE6R6G0_9ABAC|nr:orf6 [Euproctis digramma nucleopolyhedrovirus]QHB21665.1 orf6 [Artaxa digramma nucleopolyhedrovirus]